MIMSKQIIFAFFLFLTLGVFTYTLIRLIKWFKLTRPAPVKQIGKRLLITLKVAFGQTKILRKPVIGLMHALVFWGFLVILIGSIEMVIDGLTGSDRALHFLGGFYTVLTASGDVFALLILLFVGAFLFRRLFLHIKRFNGIEMKFWSHLDANIALTLILILMISLLGMNTFYVLYAGASGHEIYGTFPVSTQLASLFGNLQTERLAFWHELNWWVHILTIFFFANYLPYSKHFHVYLSIPGVFLSRLEPLGQLKTMESITKEVKLMMDPEAAFQSPSDEEGSMERFGILDVEDVNWINYFDSLSCTQCGRCTSVCPANITGKLLSPRKIMMNLRERMQDKGPGLLKEGKQFSDGKSLLRDYISEEEIWACTMCNACAQECPININQPSLILGMRQYLVMEESAAPAELNAIFSNIENNGAPWQFSKEDRMQWADDLYLNKL